MSVAGPSQTTTKLLTLLNVSATKPGKRKRTAPTYVSAKLGGRHRSVDTAAAAAAAAAVNGTGVVQGIASSNFDQVNDKAREARRLVKEAEAAAASGETSATATSAAGAALNGNATLAASSSATDGPLGVAPDSDDEEDIAASSSSSSKGAGRSTTTKTSAPRDAFDAHFAAEGSGSHAAALSQLNLRNLEWDQNVSSDAELGKLVRSTPKGWKETVPPQSNPHKNVVASWEQYRKKRHPPTASQRKLVTALSSYADWYQSNLDVASRPDTREAVAAHAVSHAIKTRRRILKNNDRTSRAAAAAAATGTASSTSDEFEIPRDQGFTRPKVLILAPLRNTALEWIHLLESFSGCPQIDNKARLEKEFNLPQEAVDKLAQPESRERYPLDHLDVFRGNIDDNFLLGVKLTRKSLKLFSAFYESDLIVASPLALRLAIEKNGDSDFLSSIEVLVVDQMEVMTMQNWDHLQFVHSHLNLIPKQAHDTDFSRVKQWYLDGHAKHLRQSVLLSAYEAPEMRALFSHQLANVAGKVRTLQDSYPGVMSTVRSGIRQTFIRFDSVNPQTESEARFQYFTNKTLPHLLKSALSSERTLIVVPSYFDFVRVVDHLTTSTSPWLAEVTFTSLSEYSSGKDIARARTEFASGRKRFLLITERFHFYRRYVLRGARNLVFYGLPEHADYFTEFMSMPFATSTNLLEALRGQHQQGGIGMSSAQSKSTAMEEVDPSEITTQVLFSRYDFLRLARIVGSETARKMVEDVNRVTWRFN